MLVDMKSLLEQANEGHYALGGFNTPNLASVRAVITAAERIQMPVILMHAQNHNHFTPLDKIGPVMIQYAKAAQVPVAVHFDHGTSLEMICDAIDMGFTSVMYDGSTLSFEDNISTTQAVVTMAKEKGVTVEAELGRMLTPETGALPLLKNMKLEHLLDNTYTDPDQAAEFVAKTGVDALAICFGTAHGVYDKPPVLDFNRIRMVKEKVSIPLVMHGGSGISEYGYTEAISSGISKINYYTYMAKSGGEAIKKWIVSRPCTDIFYHELEEVAVAAMADTAEAAMRIFTKHAFGQ